MADTLTSLVETVEKGGWPALGSKVGVVEATIDLAAANAANVAAGGGALAVGDIIQCISLPAGTVVLNAGIQIMETLVGSAAYGVTLGVTTLDPNAWVDNIDIGSGTSFVAGDYVTAVAGGADGSQLIGTGAAKAGVGDTVDIILSGTVTSGAVTAGILRVFAVCVDAGDLSG